MQWAANGSSRVAALTRESPLPAPVMLRAARGRARNELVTSPPGYQLKLLRRCVYRHTLLCVSTSCEAVVLVFN